ncbi:MAG: ankyrin repeat domain-containing protein [Sulfuricellaceae bacterium]|nr:ankyrin repeat domain-containing protein [Sulfuricellaceae bacterium]
MNLKYPVNHGAHGEHGAKQKGIFVAFALVFGLISCVNAEPVVGQNDQLIHDKARMGSGAEVKSILQSNPAMRDARTGLGSTPLHLAATNPDPAALQVLLVAGADVNAKDAEGNTPLHMAAYTNRYEQARLLLEAGADIEAISSGGRTPIALARKSRADNVAGLLALWTLKSCKPGTSCVPAKPSDINKLID